MLKHGSLAILALSAAAIAQCTIAPPSQVLNTNPPDFSSTHYLGNSNPLPSGFDGFGTLFDMQSDVALVVNQIDFSLYDDGVNPIQVGNTTNVDVYVSLGASWQTTTLVPATMPSPASPAPGWAFLGTGQLTVADSNNHSACVFAAPVVFPPGANGYYLQVHPPTAGQNPGPLHPLVVLPAVVPSTPLTAVDQFMNITNTTHQRNSWISAASGFFTTNLEFHYDPPANAAHSASYGTGCYFRPQMFYEAFPAPTSFDLANTSLTMLPQNSAESYLVVPGAASMLDPLRAGSAAVQLSALPYTSSSTTSWDDALIDQGLTFAFPFAGGSTSTLSIGSNGVIYCAGATAWQYAYYSNINAIRNEPEPVIAPAYGDWDLSVVTGTNGLWFEADTVNQKAYITYLNVPEWGGQTTLTCQVVLDASGQIEFHYGSVASNAAEVFTGFCIGSGVQDSGAQDLSATAPFQSGDGSAPSVQSISARPVTGTSMDLICKDIAANTFFSFQIVGFSSIPGGFPLAAFGLPGCSQYANTIVATALSPVVSGEAHTTIVLPNSNAYIGVQLHAQSAPLTAGLNAAGILTSSARCLVISNL